MGMVVQANIAAARLLCECRAGFSNQLEPLEAETHLEADLPVKRVAVENPGRLEKLR